MTGDISNCYRALDLEPGASLEQIKAAWRELVKVWHPDRFPNDPKLQGKAQERLKEINRAYDILERYLASDVPPVSEQAKTSSGTARDSQQGPANEQRTPPSQAPHPTSESEPSKSRAGIIFAVASIIVVVILAISVNNSTQPSGSAPVAYGSPAAEGNGSSGGTFTPAQFYTPPISKALDEKNGFKDFKFGMTLDQVCNVMVPTGTNNQPGANLTNLYYSATPVNRIGDFPVDSVSLSFFNGSLFRIDLKFSSFQNEILDAFKVNFGEPFDSDTWKRGDEPLKAKAWQGDKVSAALVAPVGQLWDLAVIYDAEVYKKAQEYGAKEPERAAAAFTAYGFRDLVMGMNINNVSLDFKIVADNAATGVKKVVFTNSEYWKYWQAIGYYPVTGVSAEFFHDRLYRIDLVFTENRKEIFEAFQHRFQSLQDNNTWTRDTLKLKGKSENDGNLFAVILAPDTPYATDAGWDAIVLCDSTLSQEADQFKKDAPRRAAKDF